MPGRTVTATATVTVAPAELLRRLFDAAVAAAEPAAIVARHLPAPPKGRTIVLGRRQGLGGDGAGGGGGTGPGRSRASSSPATATACPASGIEIVEAAHPVPDEAGHAAAARILAIARSAGPDDLVLCLISGGGSALLALPRRRPPASTTSRRSMPRCCAAAPTSPR